MPSPIGHALGGALAGLIVTRVDRRGGATGLDGARRLLRDPVVIVAALAGCAPDLDFLWGRHNMETHSLGAALAAGVAVWAWARQWRLTLAVALAWTTHVAFDWLGSDDTPPLGVMALWPLTSSFYFADAYVFEAISRRYWRAGFLAHNLGAVLRELLMLMPMCGALVWWRTRASPPSR